MKKGGGGNEIHAPCACDPDNIIYVFHVRSIIHSDMNFLVYGVILLGVSIAT
jgi:hypothetical protein